MYALVLFLFWREEKENLKICIFYVHKSNFCFPFVFCSFSKNLYFCIQIASAVASIYVEGREAKLLAWRHVHDYGMA